MSFFNNDKSIFLFTIIFLILVLFAVLLLLRPKQNCQDCHKNIPYEQPNKIENLEIKNNLSKNIQEEIRNVNTIRNIDKNYLFPNENIFYPTQLIQTVNPLNTIDHIKDYDYRKAFDPFEQPTRRIPRYEIPPLYFKRLLDIPTRGNADSFIQLGILKNEGDIIRNDQNRIIRLFGRATYPHSNEYEYYTLISSGNDQIKIPIHNRHKKKELYDGDTIYIKELDDKYRVYLHKYDQPKYYPNILY